MKFRDAALSSCVLMVAAAGSAGGQARPDTSVRRDTVALPAVAVSAPAAAVAPRYSGFEQRRSRGRSAGQFITREEIEKRNPIVTTDLLRRMQGFRIVDSMGTQIAVSTRGPKPRLIGRQQMVNCVLLVGVNGSVSSSLALNSIVPQDIHGIEIHTGATMPSEFVASRPDTYCGVIMIWTR